VARLTARFEMCIRYFAMLSGLVGRLAYGDDAWAVRLYVEISRNLGPLRVKQYTVITVLVLMSAPPK
jgi:hypothetical protein